MSKEIHCPCGYVIQAETEEKLVADAQQHAKEAHDMELSASDALAMARPAQPTSGARRAPSSPSEERGEH